MPGRRPFGLRIERRVDPPAWLSVAIPVGAALATVLASSLLFVALGYPAAATLGAFFVEPFETANGWSELALKASPLIVVALGLVACFRANVWNIGADGQFTMGAVGAGGVALGLGASGGVFTLPLMVVAGVGGGMAWAAIPALLRTRLGASEILTSLMLTYVAGLVLTTLVFGPWKDPQGYNFPQSPMFDDAALLPVAIPETRVTWGTLVGIFVLPALGWLVLKRSVPGFAITAFGEAPAAARFAGFSQRRTVMQVMLASGGLAGLAGCFEVAGPIGQLVPSVSPGYGYTAIIVAFLGRLNPLGIVPAGVLMALSYVGGDLAQVAVGLPKGATGVVQGMLLFFPLAADFFARYRVVSVRRLAVAA
jgi:simple sugar transport system permease protein